MLEPLHRLQCFWLHRLEISPSLVTCIELPVSAGSRCAVGDCDGRLVNILDGVPYIKCRDDSRLRRYREVDICSGHRETGASGPVRNA